MHVFFVVALVFAFGFEVYPDPAERERDPYDFLKCHVGGFAFAFDFASYQNISYSFSPSPLPLSS